MKKIRFPELIGEIAKRGDTQRALAKRLGLSYGAVWRRMSGRTEWSVDEINKVCEYYGKDYNELFKQN